MLHYGGSLSGDVECVGEIFNDSMNNSSPSLQMTRELSCRPYRAPNRDLESNIM